jgi:hypothetical protein
MRILLAALALLIAAPAAHADQEVATAGAVQATFTYTKSEDFGFTGLSLAITRGGTQLYSAPARADNCEEPSCFPGGGSEGDSVKAADLDADGEPEVVLDLYTGGAHCCLLSQIFRFTGATYEPVEQQWSHAGYALEDVDGDGTPEFKSADARFAYAYGSYAESAFPIQIFAYRQGKLSDVTRRFEAAIRADAAALLKSYRKRRNGRFSLGLAAAWTADQYLLGRKRAAHRFLAKEVKAGRLKGSPGVPRRGAFVRRLKQDLKRFGY